MSYIACIYTGIYIVFIVLYTVYTIYTMYIYMDLFTCQAKYVRKEITNSVWSVLATAHKVWLDMSPDPQQKLSGSVSISTY